MISKWSGGVDREKCGEKGVDKGAEAASCTHPVEGVVFLPAIVVTLSALD